MSNSSQPVEATSETRNRRGFIISLITGLIMLLMVVLYSFNNSKGSLNITDAPVLAGFIGVMCMASAWLARLGKSVLGMCLVLFSLYVAVLLSSLGYAGTSPVAATVLLVITLGITSAVFPTSLANRVNLIAIFVAIIPILLDVFDPPIARIQDPSPTITFSTGIGFLILYGVLMARQFKNYSLRVKLILAFTILSIVSVATVAIVTNIVVREQATAQVGANVTSQAKKQANSIAQHLRLDLEEMVIISLNKIVQDQVEAANASNPSSLNLLNELNQQWIGALDTDPIIQKVIDNDVAVELREFQSRFPRFVEIFTTDKNGATVSATGRVVNYYQANQDWWKVAWNNGKGAVYISKEPVINQKDKTNILIFALPIPAHNRDEIVGVLFGAVDVKQLYPVMDGSKFANTGVGDLLFSNTKVLTHDLIFKDIDQKDLGLLQTVNQRFGVFEYEGITRLVSMAPVSLSDSGGGNKDIDNLGWAFIAQQNQSEAYEPATSATKAGLLIALLVLFLAALAAVLFSNFLSAPLLSLAQTAQKVAAGDLRLQSDIRSNDEIGLLATAFNDMTAQLRELIDSLEQHVADRTKALTTSTEVSRRISTMLDEKQLVEEVVEQVQTVFNYYHVHIYFLDEDSQDLLMVGGTDEAGKTMLTRGHKISKGQGLVGRAAQDNRTVLVSDVSKDPKWLPNPLLPETRSEIAVPISIADQVLGVLDVQHNVAGGLQREDADLLESIANQVAFAIRNARSYTELQTQAKSEMLIGSIGQKILNANTLEDTIQIAARELGRALNVQETRVVLKSHKTDNRN
jgi:putative methionine-R-sulfoxide reductase with GAF domain